MPTGTLWALCSSSASSLSSLPNSKPSPPPPQGNHPHPTQLTGRPDHTSGLPSNPRAPFTPHRHFELSRPTFFFRIRSCECVGLRREKSLCSSPCPSFRTNVRNLSSLALRI